MNKTDLDLHEHILEELDAERRLDGTEIATSVKDGIVTLTGTVPSLIQKWVAEDTVKHVRGVKAVAEELKVDLPGTHQRNDHDIAVAIQQRIAWDVFLPRDVQAVVTGGDVSLTGVADWHYQIEELGKAVRSIIGVTALHNLVKIKEQASVSPDEVKRKIHSLFTRAADLDAKMVEVKVAPGAVTLKGFVHSWTERDKASQAAWSLAGVRSVDNEITVLV